MTTARTARSAAAMLDAIKAFIARSVSPIAANVAQLQLRVGALSMLLAKPKDQKDLAAFEAHLQTQRQLIERADSQAAQIAAQALQIKALEARLEEKK